jgi:hypothetical protein
LALLTLEHPILDPPLRYVRNNVNVTSRGNLYEALAFDIVLPAEEENAAPVCRLVVDNVDGDLTTLLRSVISFVYASIELVKISNPNYVEQRWLKYKITSVDGPEPGLIEAKLELDDLSIARYPRHHYNEQWYPALLRAV